MSNKYMSLNAWVKQRRYINHKGRNKIAYRSQADANQALWEIDDETLYAYECDICGHWHLTHGEPSWDEWKKKYWAYRERKRTSGGAR